MIVYESRPGCAATGHDTVWAYDRHSCRCPAAVAAKDLRRGPRRRPQPRLDHARVRAAVHGQPVRLSLAERRAAIDALAHLPAVKVADVLRIGRSTVFARRQTRSGVAA